MHNHSQNKVKILFLMTCFSIVFFALGLNQALAFPKQLCPAKTLDKGTLIGKYESSHDDLLYFRTADPEARFLFTATMSSKQQATKAISTEKGQIVKLQYNLEQKLSSDGKKCLHFYTITQEESVSQNIPLTIFEKQCSNKVYSAGKLEGTFENAIEADYALIFLRVNGERFSFVGLPQEVFGKTPQKGAKVSVDLSLEQYWDWGTCTHAYIAKSGRILAE